jgi:hypothetical protein
MSPILLTAAALLVVAQLALPRRFAFLPLAIAACQLGNREILPELTTARILIIVGLFRALAGGFFVRPNKSRLDKLFIIFSAWAVLSAVGHEPDVYMPAPFYARVGMVINVFGTYLYGRAYLPDLEAFKRYALLLPLILVPLAILMARENRNGQNAYYMLGGRSSYSMMREGRIRAQGPYQHPILAGCAGASAIAFAVLSWRSGHKITGMVGLGACLGVVLACSSSGPLAAVAVSLAGIVFWRFRQSLKYVLWSVLALALLYNIVKGRGPWYLMASIDLVGGSTGWHRAKLIDQGFTYLNEWWFMGTDYTRHWMSSGVRWNPNMIDLTNYYLHLGVTGGIVLTLCLIGFIVVSFRLLIRRMAELKETGSGDEYVLWCAGISLATHAVSFISISYFDQMYVFFYLLLGAIPGLVASSTVELRRDPLESTVPTPPAPKPLRYYS